MKIVWRKLHATWRNQGSRHTRILLQNTEYWCNLLPAQERGLRFYQTRSDAVVLFDTLHPEFIEKAVCINTGEQLYQRESERPRVALKANSQCEPQDLLSQEARSSWETQCEVRSLRETGCNLVGYRIPGISLSTFQGMMNRNDEQSPSWSRSLNPISTRNNFFKIWPRRRQKFNRFSEASQRLLKDMNQTEILELCLDCKSFTEVGIISCRYGRSLKYNRRPKPNLDCNSVDGYIIRKNCSRGPKHGPTERQEKFFKAKTCCGKPRREGFLTTPARWQEQDVKSTSPTTENWLRKLCTYSMKYNMSDEDNKHDTNYINKHKYTNHDTRKLPCEHGT